MCGISGIVSSSNPVDDVCSIVERMNARLVHRGPDDDGLVSLDGGALAMRRLAIIDVENGAQPMKTEDGRYTIVFNGEIYNFNELRKNLLDDGVVFRTSSDTEVVLRLFSRVHERVPELLKGMFAFVVWDSVESRLFVSRDRFGEKPFFYSIIGKAFAFSSEIASLLEWNAVSRQLNSEALPFLLQFGFVPPPDTLFLHVKQLPPGCSLSWHQGEVRVSRYYFPVCSPDPAFGDITQAAAELRNVLETAVARQMISDVPIGALLSGGLDSSGIAAAMQMRSSRPIKTFTMRFEYAPYDESGVARTIARHLGTDHHEVVITNSSFSEDDLWRIVEHVGQPFVDSSAIPMFQLTRALRQEVKVCLSGDGGDEMFAGYDYFRFVQAADTLSDIAPAWLLRAMAKSLAPLGLVSYPGKLLRPLRRAAEIAALSGSDRIWAVGEMFSTPQIADLLPAASKAGGYLAAERVEAASLRYTGNSRLRQLMFHRLNFALPEDMLVKVDRMSMANSVEVRSPLLDADIATFSMKLPDNVLRKKGKGKLVWREAIRPWLPATIFEQPKRGFSIPLHRYQNSEYAGLCRRVLLEDKGSLFTRLFSKVHVQDYLTRALAGQAPGGSIYRTSHQLWALLQVAAWMNYFRVTA